jgi:hypothetical protein
VFKIVGVSIIGNIKINFNAVIQKPHVIYQRPEKQSYSMWERLPAARFDFAAGSRSRGVFI